MYKIQMIEKARENCAMAVAEYYEGFGLVMDKLSGKAYNSFWSSENFQTIIAATSGNIFDIDTKIYLSIYEKNINKKN